MNTLVREITEPFLIEASVSKIKKVIGIYAGRFQPFGLHHLKTYKWLKSQVDDAYITTSDIKRPPRHPLSFKEKSIHMIKMGVPKNKIIQEKSPYKAEKALKKFDPETTAVIYIFGAKDVGRLTSGKYFQDYKSNKRNLKGFDDHGYILAAPHITVKVDGKEVSGTTMRQILSDPDIEDAKRQQLFKKLFGYFNKNVFNLMVSRFEGLSESMGWPSGGGPTIGHGYPSKEDMKKIKKRVDKERDRTDSHKKYQFYPIKEDIVIPVKVGDTILVGKFKNKKMKIKTIGKDDHGMPTINGRKAATFRIFKRVNIFDEKDEYVDDILLTTDVIDEFLTTFDMKDIIKEVSSTAVGASTTPWAGTADDGPAFSYDGHTVYKKRNDYETAKLGWKVVDYILSDKGRVKFEWPKYPMGPIGSVTYFPSGIAVQGTPNNQENITGMRAYTKWVKHMIKIAQTVGYKLKDFLRYSEQLEKSVRKDSIQTLKAQKKEYTGEMLPKGEKDQHQEMEDVRETINLDEDIKPDVINSFVLRDSLNTKLWDGDILKPAIRKKLLVIAKNFFKDLELEPNIQLKDITLTGSISNYNWSKFSDVDLHLRLDFSQIDDDENFVKNYVLAKKTIWNNKHDITIYGFPVEVYVENLGDIHVASGLYSILKDEWIVVPKKKELQIDLDDIRSKAEGYLGSIPVLEKMMKDEKYDKVIEIVEKIQDKLKRMRSSGLEKGGEFSVENLAFKALRRSPFIATIVDMKTDAYDKMMTLNNSLQTETGFSKGWWKNIIHDQLLEEEQYYARNPKGEKISVFTNKDNWKKAVKDRGYKEVDRAEAERELAQKTSDTISKQKEKQPGEKPGVASKEQLPSKPKLTKIDKNPFDHEEDKPEYTDEKQNQMKVIKSWGKDPHGNLFLGDDKVGYSAKIHQAQYVTKDENSMVIGTPHTEHDKKGKQFFEKNIVPMVEDFIEDNKGEKIVFLAEGGTGVDGHNYWPKTEQEAVGEIVKNYDKGEVDTWDGEYNRHDDGHKTAPIYTDLAEKMSGEEDETYTASDMTGAMYSNLVGQGDNGKEAMDSYLTEDGKQFLIDNGYKGSFPPKDKSEVKQLYDMNYPEDSGKEPGSNPVAKAQLAWNQLRRDNMARKTEEYIKEGYKVLVVPGATHGSAINSQNRNRKQQEQFSKEWRKELLTEGGAYGHMAHPFDDWNLTFKDFKNIIELGLSGQLNREDNVSEKLDGQNIMVSWKDGRLIAARNKGHIKNAGKNALTVKGVQGMFKGRGNIRDAFVFAVRDLQKAISSLSKKQQNKVFMDGKAFMNLEVLWPASANVINYDLAHLVFHGAIEYNDAGTPVGEVRGSARVLEGMIRQVNQHIQKKYKIGKPQFLNVPKHQDFSGRKKYYFTKLQKLQNEYRLSDSDTFSLYHQRFWEEFIYNAAKQMNYKLPNKVLTGLVTRWAFNDKSYQIANMKKDIKDEKFLVWALSFDKNDHVKYVKGNMKPFEILFFELGAEILKNISGFLTVSPDTAVQKIKKEIDKTVTAIRQGGDIEKIGKLRDQLEKFKAIGGPSAVVPSEGLVFKYKGNVYKFTGAFGSLNQIIGMLKFSR